MSVHCGLLFEPGCRPKRGTPQKLVLARKHYNASIWVWMWATSTSTTVDNHCPCRNSRLFFFGEDVWGISWYILFFRHSTGTVQKLLWKPNKTPWRNPKGQKFFSIRWPWKILHEWPKWWNPLKHVNSWGSIWWNQHEKPKNFAVSTRKLSSRPVLFLGVQIIKWEWVHFKTQTRSILVFII